MRMFVKYRPDGAITAIAKLDELHDSIEHPFAVVEDGEQALEVRLDADLDRMALFEIHGSRRVDPVARELVMAAPIEAAQPEEA